MNRPAQTGMPRQTLPDIRPGPTIHLQFDNIFSHFIDNLTVRFS
jgi:hypothetical protein